MMKSSPEHCSVQGQTEAESACRLLYKQSEQKSKNVQLMGQSKNVQLIGAI